MADEFWKKWNTKIDELKRDMEAAGNDENSLLGLDQFDGKFSKYSEEIVELFGFGSTHLDKVALGACFRQFESITSGPYKHFVTRFNKQLKYETDIIKHLSLNSAMMASVKSLDQLDKSFLILYMAPPPTLKGMESSEIGKLYLRKRFHVISVNQKRFDSGNRSKIFDVVLSLHNDPSSTRTRALLAIFIIACHTQKPNPARPKKVWFETADDANQPLVKSCMSLMGCPDIDAAPPAMMKLLRENDVLRKAQTLPKENFPYLHDVGRGIKCGNCSKRGSGLTHKCPCGKAYYCNKECQAAHWKIHKPVHKMASAEKEATKGKEGKRTDNA